MPSPGPAVKIDRCPFPAQHPFEGADSNPLPPGTHPGACPQLLSYGACQFPTLGFVVDRYWERESFQPETFWSIAVTHVKDEGTPDMQRCELCIK